MSEVRRYAIYGAGKWEAREVKAGAWVHWLDFKAQRLRADTAEAELAEITAKYNTRVEGHAKALRDLEAAEKRIAELEKDAARYQWLRDKSESVHQFYLSTPIWFTGVKFKKENVDSTIDAALNPEAESHG